MKRSEYPQDRFLKVRGGFVREGDLVCNIREEGFRVLGPCLSSGLLLVKRLLGGQVILHNPKHLTGPIKLPSMEDVL